MPARPSLTAVSLCALLAITALTAGCVQPEGGGLEFASRCGVRVPVNAGVKMHRLAGVKMHHG